MSRRESLLVIGLIIIAVLVLGSLFYRNTSNRSNPENEKLQQSNLESAKISYNCQSGKTAFEQLEGGNKVSFQGSSFGRLVTSINGVSQGNGKYWLYSIDGRDATVSADAYICQGDEKIQWELK